MPDFFTMKHPPYPLFIKRLKSCNLKLLKVSFQIWCCWKPVFAGFETSLKFKETIFIQNYKKKILVVYFDQHLECPATKHYSKYATFILLLKPGSVWGVTWHWKKIDWITFLIKMCYVVSTPIRQRHLCLIHWSLI